MFTLNPRSSSLEPSKLLGKPQVFQSSLTEPDKLAPTFPPQPARPAASIKPQAVIGTRITTGGNAFFYSMTVAGRTYVGDTSLPTSNTSYHLITDFWLTGTLAINPRLSTQNANQDSINALEVGLFVGGDQSLSTAGTLRYGTHTWMHGYWGGDTSCPAIETAYVSLDQQMSMVTAQVDPQWSRHDTANLFTTRTSLTSAPRQILAGIVQVRFANGGQSVSGTIQLFGNGYIESSAYAYTANFSGSLRG